MDYSADKVLFVDDEPNILSGIKRQFGRKYNITTANSGSDGIVTFTNEGPFAAVISDMRMPNMDGAQFLNAIRRMNSQTVRIILTGYSDLDSAVRAVNEGQIFRFITKPCPPNILESVVISAIEQYRLLRVKDEIMEKTLQGTVNVLIDILELTNPVAFSRAKRIKHYVLEISKELKLKNAWQFTVSAILSQVGCVTIPQEVLTKIYRDDSLSPHEEEMIKDYPKIGHSLLANIPHLEVVSKIILKHQIEYSRQKKQSTDKDDPIFIGSQILRVGADFDLFISRGLEKDEAIKAIKQHSGSVYNPDVVAALDCVDVPFYKQAVQSMPVEKLKPGMILKEPVRTNGGVLLVSEKQEITPTVLALLLNHLRQGNIDEVVSVIFANG